MGDTQLFLVRVWQDGAQFRAAVRAADDEQPHLFTAPNEVSEFLRCAVSSGEGSPARPSPPPPSTRSLQGDRHE